MALSSDLIAQLVKITKDEPEKPKESTLYGETTEYKGAMYVRLDGSDKLTPFDNTSNIGPGERVIVMIKNHTATVTGNLTSPSARMLTDQNGTKSVEGLAQQSAVITAAVARIGTIESDYVKTNQLTALKARIDTIESDYVTTDELSAVSARIDKIIAGDITADLITTDELNASIANVTALISDKATIGELDAVKGRVTTLESATANIGDLSAKVGKIDTLIYGSASGSSMQSSFANSVVALIGNAQIKSAMIESIDASKIAAGNIITDNITVKSNNGRLLISDETIQISDSSRVRVQIGKDASNDYSINIWDESGNLMFSEGGITDKAIKSAIIRDEMVSDSADISASKLNIDSLFTAINDDTSNTLKATKVKLDEQGQSLEVAFNALNTSVEDQNETISGHETRLTLVEGKLESKIWEQDISTAINGVNGQISTLSTNYSTLTQTVSGLSGTVASHTTQISNKADNSTVTTVSNKVTSLEQNLDGFRTTVSSTYASKNEIYRNNLLNKTSDEWTNVYVGKDTGMLFTRKHCSEYGLKAGDTITFSLEINPLVKTELSARINFYSSTTGEDGKVSCWSTSQIISKGSPGLSAITGTIPEGSEYIVLFIYNRTTDTTTTTEQYRKAKLERGDNATDWTPAISDFQPTKEILSEMDIGGANYLANSYLLASLQDGGEYYTNSTSNRTATLFKNVSLDPGTYTFSCYIKQLDADGMPKNEETRLRLIKNGSSVAYYDTKATSGEWTRATYTFTVTSSSDVYTCMLYSYTNENVEQIWVKKAKLERGIFATDWIPAQEDIDDRFNTVQTSIDQNAEAILLRATKTELSTALNGLEIGGRNLLRNSRLIQLYSNNSNTYPTSCTEMSENGVSFYRVQRINTTEYPNTTLSVYSTIPKTSFAYGEMTGKQVTLSFKARVSHEWTGGFMDFTYGGSNVVDFGKPSETFTTEWKTYYIVVDEFPDLTDSSGVRWNPYTFQLTSDVLNDFYLDVRDYKFEFGNKPTDWSPAPEDMATAKDVDTAQATANDADEKASNAQTMIAQLTESISMLVTDGNGTSLMTQTEDGWTFSTAAIQNSVNDISEALDSLTTEVGDVGSAVDILQQAVTDLGEIAEYVYITAYENEPCIELGETDSEFKLRITNTRMMFSEGSTILAYFTNQAFNSKKVVIEEELQQGEFVWKVRSNGNLGLTWKGGAS